MKAQAGVEFVFILSMVMALAVFAIATAFREMELNVVLTAARTAGEKIALENGVVLQKLDYSVNGNSVSVNPVFFPSVPSVPVDWREKIVEGAKNVTSPNSEIRDNCFRASKEYCFSFQS